NARAPRSITRRRVHLSRSRSCKSMRAMAEGGILLCSQGAPTQKQAPAFLPGMKGRGCARARRSEPKEECAQHMVNVDPERLFRSNPPLFTVDCKSGCRPRGSVMVLGGAAGDPPSKNRCEGFGRHRFAAPDRY